MPLAEFRLQELRYKWTGRRNSSQCEPAETVLSQVSPYQCCEARNGSRAHRSPNISFVATGTIHFIAVVLDRVHRQVIHECEADQGTAAAEDLASRSASSHVQQPYQIWQSTHNNRLTSTSRLLLHCEELGWNRTKMRSLDRFRFGDRRVCGRFLPRGLWYEPTGDRPVFAGSHWLEVRCLVTRTADFRDRTSASGTLRTLLPCNSGQCHPAVAILSIHADECD